MFCPIGELDLTTADATLNEWLTIVDRDRPRRVTVDLPQVTFVDSLGMRVLYLLHRRIIRQGGTCQVRGASVHQQAPA
jgi:anti-anti-sigma factor